MRFRPPQAASSGGPRRAGRPGGAPAMIEARRYEPAPVPGARGGPASPARLRPRCTRRPWSQPAGIHKAGAARGKPSTDETPGSIRRFACTLRNGGECRAQVPTGFRPCSDKPPKANRGAKLPLSACLARAVAPVGAKRSSNRARPERRTPSLRIPLRTAAARRPGVTVPMAVTKGGAQSRSPPARSFASLEMDGQ